MSSGESDGGDVGRRAGPGPIPVGVRLPLPTSALPPPDVVALCARAKNLGFQSLWVGDHVLLPERSSSAYPHTADGHRPFRAETPWADPLLQLSWLAGQLPGMRVGTSVLVVTMRNPRLLAKQLATMSWLLQQPLSIGVGSGWLREEFDAVGVRFEHRATTARQSISEMRQLLTTGRRDYTVRDGDETVSKPFLMQPLPAAPVEFLWGGVSPAALRLVASSCDGWLPAKQSLADLDRLLPALREACSESGRDFGELTLVVKPGSGPDPASGRIDAEHLTGYAELGFHEAILEMPYEPEDLADAISVLERVADRSWG